MPTGIKMRMYLVYNGDFGVYFRFWTENQAREYIADRQIPLPATILVAELGDDIIVTEEEDA